MTSASLTILGPLSAAALVLVLRRAPAMLALLGTLVGLAGAGMALAGVAGGARYGASLPGLPGLPLRLAIEPLTAVLSVLVAVVSSLVMVYAVGYMSGEEDQTRFFAQMSFFVAAMQTVVLAGDWVLLLAAWELIGFSSYLLIGFHLERADAAAGATRAFMYTRSADLGLYVAIFVLVASSGTSEIQATLGAGGAAATVAGLAMLLAAAGKSAQAPLYGWLQDAMAGPTPVSALLHSATLVAAGAILMIRVYPLLPPGVLLAVGLLGGLTALIAGLVALAQRDLKRLLAASTSSQYGFMLLALGAGAPFAATLYLIVHAAMKSSLFLGAGVFQQGRGSTDLEDLGGVAREQKWAFAGFAVSGLALAGVPPLSGFWSKDAVLAASFEGKYPWLLAPLALAGTLLTSLYVARALRLLWRGEGHGSAVVGMGWMGAGLAGLVILAATLGLVLQPLAQLLGTQPPKGLLVAATGLLIGVAGLVLGWLVPAGRLLGPLRVPAERGFRVGGGFYGLVARPALAVARGADALDSGIHSGVLGAGRLGLAVAGAARRFDERGIDGLIAALVGGTRSLGARARTLQSGFVHKELLLAVVGGAVIFLVLTLGSW